MRRAFLILLLIAGVNCVTSQRPQLTGLEKEALQTREFEGDKRTVFNAGVNALQGSGYIISEADFDTGLITGRGETMRPIDAGAGNAVAQAFGDLLAGRGTELASRTAVTAFFEELAPGRVRVRAAFVEVSRRTEINSDGGSGAGWTEDTAIYDPVVYRKFFDALDRTLFVMKSTQK